MLTNGMSRAVAVVLGLTLAVATLVSISAQGGPPHAYYGTGANPGDVIVAQVSHGDHYDPVGEATVDSNGEWSFNVEGVDQDDIEWTVNGEHADAAYTAVGESQSEVVLTVHADDAMGEDTMGEDSMGEDSMGEDSMGEDSMGEDSMGEDDMGEDSMLDEDDNGFPGTGSGGLAGDGGVSAGLIGLLIALAAVSVTGLGLRRMRNRA